MKACLPSNQCTVPENTTLLQDVAFHNHSGEDQISHDYLILLDQRYNIYLTSICSEVSYCTSVTGENWKVGTLENQLLKSIM